MNERKRPMHTSPLNVDTVVNATSDAVDHMDIYYYNTSIKMQKCKSSDCISDGINLQ
jgi:hypothetical protein